MSDVSDTIFRWWDANIGNRDQAPRSRALAARLSRADGPVAVLGEPEVHDLARALGTRDAGRLAQVAQVLAAVRTHGQLSLARRAGQDGRMSHARFDRLIRAEGNDLTTAILRALPFVERTCNVGRLGADLWFWGDAVRTRWCFDFFGGEVPAQTGESA